MPTSFSQALLNWYQEHARDLPWRGRRDPYGIWVAEIMLQQTRVETVIPYYQRWMERFPTVKALARADLNEVLALWEGLGYYRRAINLLRAATQIVSEQGGAFPETAEGLQRLSGIGPYTAAAIAAIAFDENCLAMDGNLRRVFSRIFDFDQDPRQPRAGRRLAALAWELLPAGRAGEFNQAVMDLGSLICLPRYPKCPDCPLRDFCLAYARGTQKQRPVRLPRKRIPTVDAVAAILVREGRVLLGRRSEQALLAGLWEFPGGRVEVGESEPEALRREIQEELGVEIRVGERVGSYRHSYTHFKVHLSAYRCKLVRGKPRANVHSELAWVHVGELDGYPMGKIDRLISIDLARVVGEA
jgi:A/G-specific adenine glycosylase